MGENRLSNVSKADSDEKIGEFWSSHDFTEFQQHFRSSGAANLYGAR